MAEPTAANRNVADLFRERDQARAELAELRARTGNSSYNEFAKLVARIEAERDALRAELDKANQRLAAAEVLDEEWELVDVVETQWAVRHANGHSIARDEQEAREWVADDPDGCSLIRRTHIIGKWQGADGEAVEPVPAASEPEADREVTP